MTETCTAVDMTQATVRVDDMTSVTDRVHTSTCFEGRRKIDASLAMKESRRKDILQVASHLRALQIETLRQEITGCPIVPAVSLLLKAVGSQSQVNTHRLQLISARHR